MTRRDLIRMRNLIYDSVVSDELPRLLPRWRNRPTAKEALRADLESIMRLLDQVVGFLGGRRL